MDFTAIFNNIFNSPAIEPFTLEQFLLCLLCGLFVGTMIATMYAMHNEHTSSLISTIVMLPAVVSIIILAVNDSIGTGIAVVGAFALIRFRSATGKAKEISAIFISMAAGLLIGVGYLGYSIVFTILVGIFYAIYQRYSDTQEAIPQRRLDITVPEALQKADLFDDILDKYTVSRRLIKVKTVNMGSMYRLSYIVTLMAGVNEIEMINEIRCRNGNLEVSSAEYMGEESNL